MTPEIIINSGLLLFCYFVTGLLLAPNQVTDPFFNFAMK